MVWKYNRFPRGLGVFKRSISNECIRIQLHRWNYWNIFFRPIGWSVSWHFILLLQLVRLLLFFRLFTLFGMSSISLPIQSKKKWLEFENSDRLQIQWCDVYLYYIAEYLMLNLISRENMMWCQISYKFHLS